MERFRFWPAVLGALTAAVALALLAVPATARRPVSRPPVVPGATYLALGDSVTFGYQEPSVVPTPNYKDAASFLGYPEHLGQELHLKVLNLACPGETSDSLINARALSNTCNVTPSGKNGYRVQFPLHVRYRGSQLSFAVRYLRTHPNVRLVSLMIGANDFYLCQKLSKDACLSPAEEKALFKKIAANIHRILLAIRTMAHYRGQLAIINYYSINYSLHLINALARDGNAAEDKAARPFGVEIADGYDEFLRAARKFGSSICQAGLVTQWGNPPKCGIHPSYAGQALLAEALLRVIHV